MAKYFGWGMDMSVLDFSDVLRGRGRAVSEHTIKISYGEGYVTTIKGDFNFNKKGDVTGGTVTKIDFENDDHYGNVLTGIDLSLGSFVRTAKSKTPADDASLYSKIFSRDDIITGNTGDDVIRGFSGNDRLIGGFGDDVLQGDDGDDTLIGGFGADTMTGGLGSDVFAYKNSGDSGEQSADRITDFSQAEGDKIDLSSLGFFDFDGEIRFSFSGGNTVLEVDTLGGFNFPLILRLTGEIALTEADFIL